MYLACKPFTFDRSNNKTNFEKETRPTLSNDHHRRIEQSQSRQINNIERTTKTHKLLEPLSYFFALYKKKQHQTRAFHSKFPPLPFLYVKEHENDKDRPARMTAVAGLRNDKLFFFFFLFLLFSCPQNTHDKRIVKEKKGNKWREKKKRGKTKINKSLLGANQSLHISQVSLFDQR